MNFNHFGVTNNVNSTTSSTVLHVVKANTDYKPCQWLLKLSSGHPNCGIIFSYQNIGAYIRNKHIYLFHRFLLKEIQNKVATIKRNYPIYETSADAVDDSYFHVAGNWRFVL